LRLLGAFRAIGRLGVAAALCFTASSVCFVSAVVTTTVANASFLAATTPIFAAILAWLMGRERVAGATWAAIALALAGIAIMFAEGLAAGRLLGNLLAIGAALCFAGQLVVLRLGRRVDMLPAMALGGIFTALLTGALAGGDLAVGPRDLPILLLMGTVQLALPLLLFTRGSRHVPAVQLSLLGLLDAVFNPLWVLLAVDEVPGVLTLVGGAIVLAAIAGQALLAARRQPAAP
jgi:drug/metabolite transporter (DMT)-like permease